MGNPHILAIPYPAQGHVRPLMELSYNLAKHGFRITFVNTDFNHKRVLDAASNMLHHAEGLIHLVSIPDGMEAGENRNHLGKLTDAINRVMPEELKEIIQKINRSEDDKITCVVADVGVGWALEVAAESGIHAAAFSTTSALLFTVRLSINKLIDDQVFDEHGSPINEDKMIQLPPNKPSIHPKYLPWVRIGDLTAQKIIFENAQITNKAMEHAEWLICNTSFELEPETLNLVPEILPIGPVSATNHVGDLAGSFWPEDATCLKWLGQQPPGSVIYVAFGSFTVFDPIQFRELALGLELSNRPFLWVVRPDLTDGPESADELYPKGFKERVASRGKMVGWAPQPAVLTHHSIACFVSHCGWNSTTEGVSNGVPFLCWPYFADQFVNESFICDKWKIGLNLDKDERGIITGEEIRNKLEQLLGDESLRARSLKLKELVMKSVNKEGSSDRNFKNFMKWLKS